MDGRYFKTGGFLKGLVASNVPIGNRVHVPCSRVLICMFPRSWSVVWLREPTDIPAICASETTKPRSAARS